ncbi:DUF2061 domain-containing protein [Thaumasiovibrio sp. DFM-14]|uniref:DUF2061 domain-containing protein n=1 Tax=Thaumasiovibrio sp. DFM-14 TaxID=3384792 RepID=UPI0039A28D9D
MKKTLQFAVLHFFAAFSIGYLITGDIIIGSLIALVEPLVNTGAFSLHEHIWQKAKLVHIAYRQPHRKTTSFAVVHFSVAFGVAWLLSGNLLVGGVIAIIEPLVNTVIYHFFEQRWQHNHPIRACEHHHQLCDEVNEAAQPATSSLSMS